MACAEVVALQRCLVGVVESTRGARTALYCALTITTHHHLLPSIQPLLREMMSNAGDPCSVEEEECDEREEEEADVEEEDGLAELVQQLYAKKGAHKKPQPSKAKDSKAVVNASVAAAGKNKKLPPTKDEKKPIEENKTPQVSTTEPTAAAAAKKSSKEKPDEAANKDKSTQEKTPKPVVGSPSRRGRSGRNFRYNGGGGIHPLAGHHPAGKFFAGGNLSPAKYFLQMHQHPRFISPLQRRPPFASIRSPVSFG